METFHLRKGVFRMSKKKRGRERTEICVQCGRSVPRDKAIVDNRRVTYSTELDGEDMSAAILGTPKERNKSLKWEFRFPPNGGRGQVLQCSPLLAIRQGKWKLLMNPDRSRVELYDLTKDPSEVDNVADQNGNIVAKMSVPLLKWHKSLPDADKIPADAGSNDYPWPKSGDKK